MHLLGEFSNLRCCCNARDSLPLRSRLSGAGKRLCGCCSTGISLLVGCSLDVIVNLVFADDRGWLFVADVILKTFKFWVFVGEICSFFQQLGSFLDNPKRTVLVSDWNAILEPKIDKGIRGASGSERCESSLIDLMAEFDLIDRFYLDHPGWEMWTWLKDSPFGQLRSYLDRVLVRRSDTDLVTCPTFHWLCLNDHKLVRVRLRLANNPSLAGYWKFNTSLLEIGDFQEQLGNLIQRALVGAVIRLRTLPSNMTNSSI